MILNFLLFLGNHVLKNEYKHLQVDVGMIVFPETQIPLDNLPYVFWNGDFKLPSVHSGSGETAYTNFAVAKALVVQGCVRLVAEEQVFIVSSLNKQNTTKQIVTLFPAAKCSCKAKTTASISARRRCLLGGNHKNISLPSC